MSIVGDGEHLVAHAHLGGIHQSDVSLQHSLHLEGTGEEDIGVNGYINMLSGDALYVGQTMPDSIISVKGKQSTLRN